MAEPITHGSGGRDSAPSNRTSGVSSSSHVRAVPSLEVSPGLCTFRFPCGTTARLSRSEVCSSRAGGTRYATVLCSPSVPSPGCIGVQAYEWGAYPWWVFPAVSAEADVPSRVQTARSMANFLDHTMLWKMEQTRSSYKEDNIRFYRKV